MIVTHRSLTGIVLLLAASSLSLGCFRPPPPRSINPPAEARQEHEESTPEPITFVETPAEPQALTGQPVTDDRVSHKRLLATHRKGAQAFIQLVDVRAVFRRGAFFGWRVEAYRGPGPIHRGDIILAINGRRVERPNEVMAVWEELPRVSRLTVDLLRGGRRQQLRYLVTRP